MASMGRHLSHIVQSALAVALVLSVVAAPVSSPLARLIGGDRHVECCCGDHSADHECGCPDCPAVTERQKKRRAQNAKQGDHSAEYATLRQCGIETRLPLVTSVAPAIDLSPPALAPPGAASIDIVFTVHRLRSRAVPVRAAPS